MREDVIDRLARIEEKLDSALEKQKDHERRLRRGEYSLWGAGGLMTAILPLLLKAHQ